MDIRFRSIYSSLILLPLASILILYSYFHVLLWKRRDINKTTVSKQNIKAAKTTLLIMFTCTLGWLPAVVNHMLICDQGCRYQPMDFSFDRLFVIHCVSYVLIVLKSFTNPLIFGLRQKNIREALKRLFYRICYCRDCEDPKKALVHKHSFNSLRMKRLQELRNGSQDSAASESSRTTLLPKNI